MKTFIKDPDAKLDYQWDWSDWLDSGDEIASAVFTVPSGLTNVSNSKTTTTATIWLSGGTAGETYEIACEITTAQTRIDERTVCIRVRHK